MAATPTTAENKALVRRLIEEAANEKDFDVYEELLANDFILHTPSGPEETVTGVEAYEEFVRGFFEAFPDLTVTIEEIVAEDDLVAYRATYTGTHEGDIMGIPATGKTMRIDGNVFVRMVDGKVAELNGQLDTLRMMQQLGVTELPSE